MNELCALKNNENDALSQISTRRVCTTVHIVPVRLTIPAATGLISIVHMQKKPKKSSTGRS